ncbi:methyltransferase domain-containing protein [Burkholderia plantarii]|uniref:Methyltransferase, type 11 n=1 Tax=Burkholderia plantarii TaxID=41899 RepID=A0A0B6S5V3_BURPL|nr:methyltransferase domain-containing protein [Burkholderia plantarii]AJK47626.1 methyltransferase, type 11 [Burkholderia plantarii]
MSEYGLLQDTEDLARHYESVNADRQFRAGRSLVDDYLTIGAGEAVLDVGTGTGQLAEYVAARVGPTGSVVGIDPLPLRIEFAARKALPNLRFEIGDAYDLGQFAAASFDVVYLNAVLHWLDEKRGPLSEFARVLRPGGRLGIMAGAKGQGGELGEIRARVLARAPFDQYPETSGQPHPVTADELAQLLDETGFEVETIDVRANQQMFATPQALIDYIEASSFGNFLGHLPDALKARAADEIATELAALATSEGVPQGGARLFARARRR